LLEIAELEYAVAVVEGRMRKRTREGTVWPLNNGVEESKIHK
jgi:hypothetical protein